MSYLMRVALGHMSYLMRVALGHNHNGKKTSQVNKMMFSNTSLVIIVF
jgi:hypothetical protein